MSKIFNEYFHITIMQNKCLRMYKEDMQMVMLVNFVKVNRPWPAFLYS